MKKILNIFMAVVVVATMASCENSQTGQGSVGDYVIFAETLSTNAVEADG